MTQTNTHEKRRQKEQLYELFAQVATALANPHRLELIDLLVQAPRTVDELAQEAHMSIANTSQHLQRLKQAHLVLDERQGLYVRYRVADPAVTCLWIDLRALADRQHADVERALNLYRDRRHEFQTLTPAEVQERLQRDEALLLDVRPSVEYEAAHIPGAVSIPYNELEGRLSELPPSKLIVTYCRGPYCVYADDVLGTLTEHGWQVARLEEGVVEWQLLMNELN
jgi:rhodanese-related sulfurtransferase/predicted transcriptional regulator